MDSVSKQKEWLFSVDGVHCIRCIRKIQELSKDFDKIKSLKVDIGHKSVKIVSEENFETDRFMKKLESEGYGVKNIPLDENAKYKKSEAKKLLARLGVAGACSGNIMLVAVAEYSGADLSEWGPLFSWIGFAFFIPVLLFSSYPFYLNSFNSLKNKKVSIDSPIAIAIVGGGALSFYKLLQGSSEVYFDSISMFVFFLLGSRYFILKLQSKYLSPVSLEDVYSQKKVIKFVDGDYIEEEVKSLQPGDMILIKQNEYLPIDGELYSEAASISDAFFSGEFFPKERKKFDKVHAGSKNISKEVLVRVLKPAEETRLSSIIDKLNISLSERTEMSSLADEGANYLTYVVLFLSVLFIGIFSFIDLQEGINRVLALLVVACPCGLAIATPLVQSLGVKLALKNSVLIKNATVFEKVGKIRNIVFDKTGTLTKGDVEVLKWHPQDPNQVEKELIYNLEKNSEHPIALALIKNVGEQTLKGDLKEFEATVQEAIGKGVSAVYEGDFYEIKTVERLNENTVGLFKNGAEILRASLGDEISEKSFSVVKKIKELGLCPYLLSGDHEFNAVSVGKLLGISPEDTVGGVTPEEKADFIENLSKEPEGEVLYIGDGVNDSLAMSKSLVSISMDSAADVAFKSSDVHILSGGIEEIVYLVELSKRSLYSIKWIFAVSLIYNATFAVIALSGFITPLWAVIIMPASSVTVTILGFYMMLKGQQKGREI